MSRRLRERLEDAGYLLLFSAKALRWIWLFFIFGLVAITPLVLLIWYVTGGCFK